MPQHTRLTTKRSRKRSRKRSSKRSSKRSGKRYHTLLYNGGQGCIFKPYIKCKGSDGKIKRSRRTISKVMFKETSANREFSMNERIRKIPGHKKWSILWKLQCETPEYRDISEISDIDKCIARKQVDNTPRKTYPMLVGEYGGESLHEYGFDTFKLATFDSQTRFDAAILKVFRILENTFVGLHALRKHKITHGDITGRNILVDGSHTFIIDFGLSYQFTNVEYVQNHLKFLFQGTDRIYEAYPYEYILYHGHIDTKGMASELNDLKKGIHRESYEEYLKTHGDILGKGYGKLTTHIRNLMKLDITPKLSSIIQSLDTYSVGMLLPTLIHNVCQTLDIPIETVSSLCRDSVYPEIFELLRDMTSYASIDRVSPDTALKRYHAILKTS